MQRKIIYFEICNNIEEYKIQKLNNKNKYGFIEKIEKYKINKHETKISQKGNKVKNKIKDIIKSSKEKLEKIKFNIIIRYNLINRFEFEDRILYVIYQKDKRVNTTNIDNNQTKILKKIDNKLKMISKNNNKIVLSKQIKEMAKTVSDRNSISYISEIVEYYEKNKYLYNNYINEIIDSIIKLNNKIPEEQSIYILIKENKIQNINKIIEMIPNYKIINIITPNIRSFRKLEDIWEEEIESITILNNKRKSLSRAQYIINIDFTEKEVLEYNICRTAIIFNISNSGTLTIKNFDGTIINNIKIKKCDNEGFELQDRYTCGETNINEIPKCINKYWYDLIGNNGNINFKELLS